MEEVHQGLFEAAKLLSVTGASAPKAKGVDSLRLKIIGGRKDVERIAGEMEKLGEETGRGSFPRDGGNVLESDAVLLVGCVGGSAGLNCGAAK